MCKLKLFPFYPKRYNCFILDITLYAVVFLGLAPRAQMLNKSSLIGDKAPPTACDSIEVARALTQRCYPGRHSQSLSGSLPLSVEFTTH